MFGDMTQRIPSSDRSARRDDPLPRHVGVFVVGAGFGGLGMAIRLQQRGVRDFLVVDKGHDVGGTWRDNTYPGAACDVPSQLYSFSFARNPGWTRSFSPQPERWGGISGSAISFSLQEITRTHGQPARSVSG